MVELAPFPPVKYIFIFIRNPGRWPGAGCRCEGARWLPWYFLLERWMLRFVSLVGMAVLAVTAAALAASRRTSPEEPPPDNDDKANPPRLHQALKIPASSFHAAFSIN